MRKQQTTQYSRFHRPFAITLILGFCFACLAATASVDRFYLEPAVNRDGTTSAPMIMVKAVKNKEVYDTVDKGHLQFSIQLRGQCPERHSLEREVNITCHRDYVLKEDPAYTAETDFPVTIRCMPTGYTPTTGAPPRHGVKMDPPITSVEVIPEPAQSKGHACPVTVNFRGRISASENRPGNEPLKIRYRFVGDRNFETAFYDDTIRTGETKPVFWKRRIEAATTQGGRDRMAAPGMQAKIPIYEGWTRLEVVYPDWVKSSDKAAFTVDCNASPQRTTSPPPRSTRIRPNND